MLSEVKALFCFQVAHTAHFLDECFISTILEEKEGQLRLLPFLSVVSNQSSRFCVVERG